MHLADLLDVAMLHKLAEANYRASGMPIGLIDAKDGTVLVGFGWQDICTMYHRVNAITLERCRESDDHIRRHLSERKPCEYTCRNGLRDIGVPIRAGGEHLATLFLGQFFYEGETPDRSFFEAQARQFGFDERAYLAALDRVPVFSRAAVDNILAYNVALASFVSDLAEAALRRNRVEEELRDANRAKDDFLGMLSHELRNPLAPIRNALYILEHAEPAGQQARRAKEVAARQLAHLSRLVDDLLDVTRIVRNKVELRRKTVDLADLARRTGEDHRALMHERDLEFAVEIGAAPAWVDGDDTRLAQVIANLLGNAAKFTPAGGRVTLFLVTHDDAVIVGVRDTGSGVEPELLGAIFDPFVQAKQTLARTEGGLGLGLALVKGLVELHGGSVGVESEGRGKGAQFTFRLPLLSASHLSAERRGAAGHTPPRRRVLVVDDNRDAAESLADLVQLFGHEAEVAFDGPSALAKAGEHPPDVVLCDIGLPGMSGYDVARAVRADPRLGRVRLVAVSGYAQPEDRQRAREAGFEEHVAKPPDPAKIEKLLEG